ncbi:MAG TPA: hypothetical protein PKA55_09510 [Rhodoblastus sp.]|nr:hypothetical protein [Rhodoblastus sp.]
MENIAAADDSTPTPPRCCAKAMVGATAGASVSASAPTVNLDAIRRDEAFMIVLPVLAARECPSDPFRIASLVIAFVAVTFIAAALAIVLAITWALRWC